MFAKEHFQTETLLEALVIEEGDDEIFRDAKTTEDEILHWASSLLRRSKHGGLELAHFTVKEFLFSIDPLDKPQFAPYSACKKDADIQLVISCLTYLNSTTFSNTQIREVKDITNIHSNLDYEFLRYTVEYWDSHAFENMENDTILTLTLELFCPTISRQFIVYRYIAYSEMSWYDQMFDEETWKPETLDDTTPLHWAAYLGLLELSAWLLEQGLPASQMSGAGTPMNCALLGDLAICRADMAEADDHVEDLTPIPERETRHLLVELFLKNGASPYLPQSLVNSMVPLSMALRTRDLASCSILLAAGAKFSASDISHLAEVVDWVEYYDIVKLICTQAMTDISTIQPDARGALFNMASLSFTKIAKKFLRILSSHPDALKWASSINFDWIPALNPEILWSESSFAFFYSLLANMQVDLRSTAVFPSRLRKLIIDAVKDRNVYFITSLSEEIPGVLLSLRGDCDSLLHIAIQHSMYWELEIDLAIINLLLNVGYKPSDQNTHGETPLHYAAKRGRLDIFQLLMASPGAEDALYLGDQYGKSAFDYALSSSPNSVVDFISQRQQTSAVIRDAQMVEMGSSEGRNSNPSLKRLLSDEEDQATSCAKRQRDYSNAAGIP